MPYLNCQECRLVVYSAARYSTYDSCPRCGAALSTAPRRAFAPAGDLARTQSATTRDLQRRFTRSKEDKSGSETDDVLPAA
ncbi:MAG: hypothetical protein M3301_08075 [Chloroflexota bacterium]|nr:hypothetical protein [Chloroflexota bacterium]